MMLSTSSVTGPAELCLDDARALREAGHEVEFACDTRRSGNYAQAIAAAGFALDAGFVLCPRPTPGEVLRDIRRLRGRVAAGEIDLVHARFAHDHSVALAAARGLRDRLRIVRTAETARSLGRSLFRAFAFRRTDGVLVAASRYRTQLVREHRVAEDRVEVLPGRVDAERFSPGDGRGLRSRIGLDDGAPLVGIVSRVKPERRHVDLIRAFEQVASRHPAARLVVVGRGEGLPEVQAEVGRLGLRDRVHYAGYVTGPDLVEAYRALDVAVWLAEGNDGTSRAVLEAMACGKPVVGTRSGAIDEIIRDGETGFAVQPGAVDELARVLERLLASPELRRRLGEAGRQRAAQEFSPATRATALLGFYERVRAMPPATAGRAW